MAVLDTLTTYTAVGTNRLGLSGTTDKTTIDEIIDGVTSVFAGVCNRPSWFRDAAKIEYLTGDGGKVLRLSLLPIESITSVILASDRDFTNGDTLTADDDYRHNPENGLLFYEVGAWPRSRNGIKVTYVGGYVHPDDTPTGVQVPLPAAIIEAAIQQTIAWYKRRSDYSTKGEKAGDGSVAFIETNLLPSVKATLAQYLRYAI